MSDAPLHPAAAHDLPSFITPAGETDVLMVVMALILLGSVIAFGVLFFRLHTLPERIAHRGHKLQFEIVAGNTTGDFTIQVNAQSPGGTPAAMKPPHDKKPFEIKVKVK